ncbi:MAG: sigma-54 dependent transcriptional regulator [Aliishimia sp.]
MTRQVLVVEDNRAVRDALGQTLELANLEPILAGSFIAAKDHISPLFQGVILSDIRMPGRDGFHLLSYAKDQDEELPVVLLTGEADVPMAVQAMSQGAFAFLEKPCAPSELMQVLYRALQTRSLVLENRALRTQVEKGDPAARMLFGTSGAADQLRSQARRIAQAQSDALVLGAKGSGISKVAEVIHLCSPNSKAPFVKRAGRDLNPLAAETAQGLAHGGSLFIDEATHLPMETQLYFAEWLEHRGRARLLLGTTADLEAEVTAERFNADLYYRLSGMTVRIPALSERREDIPVMFQHYVALACEQAGLEVPDLRPDMLADLMGRDWNGNARALMSEAMRFSLGLDANQAPDESLGLAEQMAQVEKTLLEQALRRADGRATVASKALKLPRKTFYDKLTRHGIRAEAYRDA